MSTALARRFRIDVTADLTLAGSWLQYNGIDDWNPSIVPDIQESTAYDTDGWKSREVTLQDWSFALSSFRRQLAGVFDPGQELVNATVGQFGDSARLGIRWYDKFGGPEAWQGICIPTVTRNNTGVDNLEKMSVAGVGDGAAVRISNPGVAAVAALLVAATPGGAAAGEPVEIKGAGLTGTTGAAGVKIGGTNAAKYIVVSDNVIVATLPAGSAGSAPIVVNNGVGNSNSLPYTRGA